MATKELKAFIKKYNPMISLHDHDFTKDHVPNGFLKFKFPYKNWFLKPLEEALDFLSHVVFKKEKREALRNYESFVRVFNSKNSMAVFEQYLSYFPVNGMVSCILSMDMSEAVDGKMNKTIYQQLDELADIKAKYPDRVLIAVSLAPENPEMSKIWEYAKKKGIADIVKYYPCIYGLPTHSKMWEIWAECEANKIPIVCHTSSAAVTRSSNKYHLCGMVNQAGKWVYVDKWIKLTDKPTIAQTFNNPVNWIPVLEKHPNLYLDYAHFGGSEWPKFLAGDKRCWPLDIIDIMGKYPNVYTDFSYTLWKKEYCDKLKDLILHNQLIRERVLFGSDYYMVIVESSYRAILTQFKTIMGDDIINQIARINPNKFLNI